MLHGVAAQDALDHGSVGTTVAASIVGMVMSTATYECALCLPSHARLT